MKSRAKKLLNDTQEKVSMLKFSVKHKTEPEHFTRKSPLNYKRVTITILNMIKKPIKVELMDVFYQMDKEKPIPSRQAFSQAREKISYTAFQELFELSCEAALESEEPRMFKGYRLFAFDGTSFFVGDCEKVSEYFGESTTVAGKSMCRIGAVVDVLEETLILASAQPFSTGERVIAINQIERLRKVINAILLFDRGYWSPELVKKIIKNRQKFVMRLASNHKNVTLKGEILRKFSFILPSGEEEILLTNLSENEMSNDELAALYAKRWGIETKYLELKSRLQIDHISGESYNVILQDIYATLYISNLAAFICLDADEEIQAKNADKDNKYEQKANRSVCIAALRRRFVEIILLDDDRRRNTLLQCLHDDICKCVTYVAKSKSRPRDKRKIKSSRAIKRHNLL